VKKFIKQSNNRAICLNKKEFEEIFIVAHLIRCFHYHSGEPLDYIFSKIFLLKNVLYFIRILFQIVRNDVNYVNCMLSDSVLE